jgi:hypothetical protein
MLSGFSYKSNQYGLSVDNVAGYELVLPNGTVTNVTSNDDDLWFGLRVSGRAYYYKLALLSICREGSIISYALIVPMPIFIT